MRVGRRLVADMPSAALQMALAVEIPLPEDAPRRNQTALAGCVERAAAGDKAAFEQIMIHWQQRVLTLSWRMLGSEADARDASQEVFLRVYKYLGRFKQDQDFFAWLYRITVNVCRDLAKKRQHQSNRFTSLTADTNEAAFAVTAGQEDAEEALIHTQQRQLITRAMATLPEKERASIVLRDVEGLPTAEVARIMKSSPTTVS